MKKYFSILLLIGLATQSFAQEIQDLRKEEPSSYPYPDSVTDCKQLEKPKKPGVINPLSPSAFDKFITDKYSYTILGSLTPATGLKFETSNPSISLKGNLYSNKHRTIIGSIELTGGIKDGLMDIFSQNKLNSYFRMTASLNVLLSRNWARFDDDDIYLKVCHLRMNAVQKYQDLLLVRDTALVLNAMTHEQLVKHADKISFIITQYSISTKVSPSKGKSDSLVLIVKEFLERYDSTMKGKLNNTNDILKSLNDFADDWTKPGLLKKRADKDKFIAQHKKFNTLNGRLVDSLHIYEINAVKDIWTKNQIRWLTFSPIISHNNFGLYDTTAKTIAQRTTFLYGGKVAFNLLRKYKEAHRYLYLTAGLSAQKVNTLSETDLTKFTYKKTEQLKVPDSKNSNSAETITREESGTAYRGEFKNGFGFDAGGEIYWVPWSASYIPGLYGQVKYSYGDPWRTRHKAPLALGLVFNVTSSDKDAKNLLTIVPYAKWSSIFKLKDADDPNSFEPLHDRFSVGVMVGIPINIGK